MTGLVCGFAVGLLVGVVFLMAFTSWAVRNV
jgi:hypothetical protein